MTSPPPLGSSTASHVAETVAVIGAGSIGIAWAVVFASAGVRVQMFETAAGVREGALGEVESMLNDLSRAGLLAEPVADVLPRVTMTPTLDAAVEGAGFVQECVIEDIEVKRGLFAELDRLTDRRVVLASSTSTIIASLFAEDLPGRERCLVVHPANPPYFLRVAEVVPAPFTSADAIAKATELLTRVDITPIVLHREIEGFVFNRLQGAVLREAYCLVRDGVISPVDVDTLVREGLGLRWSVIGPFTTSELNTRGGLRRHAEVIGPVYARIGVERGSDDPWTTETIEHVASVIEQRLPHPTWEENVHERDRAMIRLASLLRHFDNPLATPKPITTSLM
ncbi:3-hydroxyacyl-CoA dehydrogenase [Microbacterium rhizomatis]|uniref:3-hydroxyacyl-CoA dehydrogenase n=1 Tax=Microbacterium rhizomatis TaxID=1631477 RepID=A0A5J5IZC1_9MICO|nr:3-hydroxyacyl-CoA dehydrogenase [Microbacterium rhizomatis]KAA9106577.1 3-hydroxyacyl-CoA dehydrogenase [Microbacterium rhizomatis]